jgi:hypothetical protein
VTRSSSVARGERGDSDADSERKVTQRQAAELVGCSKDTIIRARLARRLPRAHLDGHTWLVPVGDLIAAGLYDPGAKNEGALRPALGQSPAPPVSMELARAQARITALEELVARQDDELRFLRQLTTDTLVRRAS